MANDTAGPKLDLWKFLLVCEVFAEDVKFDVREGVSAKTGKPWKTKTQRAYFKKPSSRFPKEFLFSTSRDTPYPAGLYLIDPDSFDNGDYDSLEISRFDFELVPVPSELAKQLDDAAAMKLRVA